MKDSLPMLRQQIDEANTELVQLLNKRADIARQIGIVKGQDTIYQPAREAQVLAQVITQNNGPLSDQALTSIFTEIIGACRNLEQQLRVAYLGPEGTYSQEAATQFAGSTSAFIPCVTIDEAFLAAQKGSADIALIPVENSSEGAVHRALDLLLDSSLHVVGEVMLPIHHQLLGKQKEIEDIKEVVAHAQALAQCREWLTKHLPSATLTPVNSNGEAARQAAKSQTKAAIAGRLAADIYKLPVIRANIEDVADNTTRFLAVGSHAIPPTGHDKTSLVCSVPNRAGSLHALLGIFARAGINMTKLESRPGRYKLWEYVFYIDIDGHRQDASPATALGELQTVTTSTKILGSYPKAPV